MPPFFEVGLAMCFLDVRVSISIPDGDNW